MSNTELNAKKSLKLSGMKKNILEGRIGGVFLKQKKSGLLKTRSVPIQETQGVSKKFLSALTSVKKMVLEVPI